MNAGDMINRCFRHQHPEAYGRDEVHEPAVPLNLRYGSDSGAAVGEHIPDMTVTPDDVRLLGQLETDFEVSDRENRQRIAEQQ